ncbi:MAG: hypothetical protein LRZ88_04945 [Candidatus Cloacimonetes bacterium]|nr:hypothetical protein [Candidatus Cloacimonadota bacterium]
MTNTGRNSIVLSSLLVVIVSAATFLLHSIGQKVSVIKAENEETSAKLAVLDSQISNIDSLMMEYEIRKAMVSEQSKVILAEDNPTITYQYLLRVLSWLGKDNHLRFSLSDKGKGGGDWNNYVISGRSNYMDVAHFTRFIEHQRALLTLEELSIGSDGVANSDTVSFSMVLRTHYAEGGLALHEVRPKSVKANLAEYQLFRSRVWDSAQFDEDEEADPRLVNIDSSNLIGVAEGRIFLRDSQGVIRILNLRDRVKGGYLYSIDVREGRAIFRVDKYGLPENQILHLHKEN